MTDIRILYTNLDGVVVSRTEARRRAASLLECFPGPARPARLPDSQLACVHLLAGWSLALTGFRTMGQSAAFFSGLYRTTGGKPLHPDLDFNISHSGAHVVCAISASGSIGIDLEDEASHTTLPLSCLRSSSEYLEGAGSCASPLLWWTAKEAVIKASGEEGVDAVRQVTLAGDRAVFRDISWQLYPVALDGAVCHLATRVSGLAPTVESLDARKVLKLFPHH